MAPAMGSLQSRENPDIVITGPPRLWNSHGVFMGIADRLYRLVPDLSAPLARFPIPALISVLLAVELAR